MEPQALADRLKTDQDAQDDDWVVTLEENHTVSPRARESVLTVGDGEFGTRGSREEDGVETVPLVLANGLYDGTEEGQRHLAELPSWTALDLPPDLPPARYRLDLRSGTLERIAEDEDGPVVATRRFACLSRPGVMVFEADVRADAAREAGLVPDDGGARERIEDGARERDGASGASAVQPGPVVRRTSERVLTRLGGGAAVETSTSVEQLPAEEVHVTRLAAYEAAAAGIPSSGRAAAKLQWAERHGPKELGEMQKRQWSRRWSTADVIVHGHDEITRLVRFALYHLMASVPSRGEAAVGARGLTGSSYLGHVFWDADVFVLPFFAATHPASAHAMVLYRTNRLDAARLGARQNGRRGARFPWESAKEGRDVTPRFANGPSGRHIPIMTGVAEEHITADVAWSAWQHAAWTGDTRLLRGEAWPLFVETARYWMSRALTDPEGRAHILGVIGPDEYHELVDDNAFTNVMAAWNLDRAADLVEMVPFSGTTPNGSRPAVFEQPGASEVRAWRHLARSLVTGYEPSTGIYEQFRGYHDLEPLSAASFGTPPYPADLVLGHDRVTASQIIKQADALMLHLLVADSVVDGSLGANLDFYLPRTCHGSSLSPAVHAALLARAGRVEEAESLLHLALHLDIDDLTGTAWGGVHMANLGGIWQAIVTGFGGIRPTAVLRDGQFEETLLVDPHLPPDWEALEVHLSRHGSPMTIVCRQDGSVEITTPSPLTIVRGDGSKHAIEPPVAVVG